MQKDPQRTAIHAKLLEIYANRRSMKQFETLASELYAQTAGIGPDWEQWPSWGQPDPGNPLYTNAAALNMAPAPVVESEIAASAPVDIPALPEEPESSLAVDEAAAPESGLAADGAFERDTLVLPSR